MLLKNPSAISPNSRAGSIWTRSPNQKSLEPSQSPSRSPRWIPTAPRQRFPATANASKTFDDLLKEDKKEKSGDERDSGDDLDIERFTVDAKEVSKETEKDGEGPM